MAETASLADPAPLAHLVHTIAAAGLFEDHARTDALADALALLPDPSLAHLLELRGPAEPVMVAWALRAARSWPLARASALALLVRWLRRRHPEGMSELFAEAARVTDAPPGPDAARWLFFVDGPRLARLSGDPAWRERVEEAVDSVVEALARAPKSVSQANAERLLARAVYADPGHFLFELLQNADDAGAARWTARFEGRDVIVENDGAPLSVLDLVGLLSIGQTTKRAEQIGFFGVGFKSVYEVCERPRVHSGPFDVEIAHVSIPRQVATVAGRDVGQTRLILPLRDDVDVGALAARARAIPPETLLTLPHVSAVSVVYETSTGWREEADGDEVVLRAEDGRHRRYVAAEGGLSWRGERAEGRSRTSAVKVFIPLDDAGEVVCATGPTLFAFLPTAERTGLRVKVHARFDVTLDRERLEQDSEWNAALLEEAGRTLARAVARLAAQQRPALSALASRDELDASVWPLFDSLADAVKDVPCVRTAGGDWVRPSDARLTSPDLAAALAHEDLGGGARAVASDHARLLLDLGASRLEGASLVDFLEHRLVPGQRAPSWLPAVHASLAEVQDERLRSLPLLSTAAGLVVARDASVAPDRWAALYEGVRPVISESGLAALPRALRDRLAVPELPRAVLVDDLLSPVAADLRVKRAALLTVLAELPDADLERLRGVAVLEDESGAPRSIHEGLCRLDPRLEPLRGSLSALRGSPSSLHVVAAGVVEANRSLLERWLPEVSFSALADVLERAELDAPVAGEVLSTVAGCAASLPASVLRRFESLRLFEDTHGELRPLVGADRAWMPRDPALREAAPAWPWLSSGCDVRVFSAASDGVRSVLHALVEGAFPLSGDERVALIEWCVSEVDGLTRADTAAMLSAPVWADTDGAPRGLDGLRRGQGSNAIDAYYAQSGSRAVAHPASLRLLDALGHADALPRSDHAAFVQDQVRRPDPARTDAWADALEEASRSLPPDELAPILSAPVFLDEEGTPRAMASWDRDETGCHRPGPYRALLRASGRALLAAADEARFAGLFAQVGPPEAQARDLIANASPLADAEPERLLDHLLAGADQLDDALREVVRGLPLFTTLGGTRAPLSELASPAAFVGFEDDLEALAPLDTWATESALEDAARLGLRAEPPAARLTRLLSGVRVGQRLAEQPAYARERHHVLALAALVDEAGLPVEGTPLALNGAGELVPAPLPRASSSTLALLAETPVLDALADPAWAVAVSDAWRAPLSLRRVAATLRETHSDEASPPNGWLERVCAFVREHGDELAEDPDALASFGGAAIWPSQQGPLRAARSLVLDGSLPDVGLAWGLAQEVPGDVAAWLASHYELDRRTRSAVVNHLLDGMDQAREADDRERAHELLRVLASALNADGDPDELEGRCRRSKVRNRLQVPLLDGGWEKPRFAWAPADEVADVVPEFALEVPPQLDLRGLDPGGRALLAACGATADLDDAAVLALLDGHGRRSGERAELAFAGYLAARAVAQPARLKRWSLDRRAWIPAWEGGLRAPASLLAPTALARAFFGDTHGSFPHPDVFAALPADAALRVGCRDASTLGLEEVASGLAGHEARPALLDWLEAGLVDGRFTTGAVRAALRERLLLRDDEGIERRPAALAQTGARALFGDRRGDYGAAQHHPKLARALGIPRSPDAPMMLAFLDEIGAAPPAEPSTRLSAALESCLERLARSDTARLPEGAALPCLLDGAVVVLTVGDPRVRMLAPPSVAELGAFERFADPLPAAGRTSALRRMLQRSGVPDLLAGFDCASLDEGPTRDDLDRERDALAKELAPVLAGAKLRVVDGLMAEGTVDGVEGGVRFEVDAFLREGMLSLTPRALETPAALAPALAPRDARRRAALEGWLEDRARPVPSRRKPRPAPSQPREGGWLGRMKRWFQRDDEEPDSASSPAPSPAPAPRARRDDKRFFAVGDDVLRGQLDRTEGWLDDRRDPPSLGFAFTPPRLEAPWVYAPKLVVTEFDPRAQSWRGAELPAPVPRGQAGMVALRGRLPAGEVVVPVPHYGRLLEVRLDRGEASAHVDPTGRTRLTLDEATDVRLRVQLGRVPDLDRAAVADLPGALQPFVPDRELPDEVLDRIADLRDEPSPLVRAIAVRDFIRARYRYDPTYLEDPSVGRWLARRTRGHAHQHLAALHAAGDREHLGAGVCYELNVLACAMMRATGVPAAVATGWVFDGGSLSEPDHLWALALLKDARGAPAWVPIDASTTRDGRPLRVPRRPPGRFRPPRDPQASAPAPTRWDLGRRGDGGRGSRPTKKKRRRVPRAELRRVLVHLERVAKRALTPEERRRLDEALADPDGAAALLERIRS